MLAQQKVRLKAVLRREWGCEGTVLTCSSDQLVIRLSPTAKLHIKAYSTLEEDKHKSLLVLLWITESAQLKGSCVQHILKGSKIFTPKESNNGLDLSDSYSANYVKQGH